MAFTVKATAISPKPFNVGKMRRRIHKACEVEGFKDAKEFRKTTDGWSEAPPMGYEIEIKGDYLAVWIGPKGPQRLIDKWRRIDEGTPTRGWTSSTWMVFPFQGVGASYDAKTTPRKFSSKANWTKKGPIRKTKQIKAHSIEPRLWSETLANRRIKPFAESVQLAINRGLAP